MQSKETRVRGGRGEGWDAVLTRVITVWLIKKVTFEQKL